MSKRCEDFSRISLFPFKNLKLKLEKKEEEKRDFFSIKCTQRRVFFVVGCSFPWSICQKPTTPPLLLPRMKMPAIAKRDGGKNQKVKEENPAARKNSRNHFPEWQLRILFLVSGLAFPPPPPPGEKQDVFELCEGNPSSREAGFKWRRFPK